MQPEMYCSGSESSPRCSELWYPSDLDRYELIDSGGISYLCKDAIGGSFGDYDCGPYAGGDPAFVYTGELKCSDTGFGFECVTEFYPSELEGLTFITVGINEYVCKNGIGGLDCFLYFGGSPRDATFGLPDLYCNRFGDCAEDDYP
jgi:hypothetical protein